MNKELCGSHLPACMIGTWAWGTGLNGSRMIFGQTYKEEQLITTFHTAVSLGFTLWDTAEVYGMGTSEQIVGKCTIGHKDVLLSTKYCPAPRFKKGKLSGALQKSLTRLGTDSVDLYWLHEPYALKENLMEMATILKSGKIKNIGLSNCSLTQLKMAVNILAEYDLKLAAVQNRFSLLSMDRQNEIVMFCKENNILFFGYMVLEQGALSGNYDETHPFPFFSMRRLMFGKKKFQKIRPLLFYQKELAEKYHVDAAQIPIAWAISKDVIPIVGLTRPRHARSLAAGIQITLLPEEIEKLEMLARASGIKRKGIWE